MISSFNEVKVLNDFDNDFGAWENIKWMKRRISTMGKENTSLKMYRKKILYEYTFNYFTHKNKRLLNKLKK